MRCVMSITSAALLSILIGRCTASVAPDVEDTACVIGQACTPGVSTALPNRGLCVQLAVNGSKECWDVCNTAHAPTDFSLTNSLGMALLVQQQRTVNGGCSGADVAAGTGVNCILGTRCTPPQLPHKRGLCVLNNVSGNVCLDMCDMSLGTDKFKTPGKEAGTVNLVGQVRAGRDPQGWTTCPGPSVWVWLWFPILLIILLTCCAGAYYMYKKMILKRGRKGRGDDMDGAMLEEPPAQDYQQVMPQDYPPEMQSKDLDMPPPMDQAPEPVAYNEPMPVNEPVMEAPPMYAEQPQYSTDLFGQPNLMGGQAPNTFSYTSQPAAYPQAYQGGVMTQPMQYTTGQPSYSGYPATASYAQYR